MGENDWYGGERRNFVQRYPRDENDNSDKQGFKVSLNVK